MGKSKIGNKVTHVKFNRQLNHRFFVFAGWHSSTTSGAVQLARDETIWVKYFNPPACSQILQSYAF